MRVDSGGPSPRARFSLVSPGEGKPSQFTVRELAERFLKEHIDVYLKPSTQYAYRRILEKYIIPEYGNRHFESVTRANVKALRARRFDKSHKFEYVLCVLGSLYTRIIDDWKLSDMGNPTSGIKRRPSRRVTPAHVVPPTPTGGASPRSTTACVAFSPHRSSSSIARSRTVWPLVATGGSVSSRSSPAPGRCETTLRCPPLAANSCFERAAWVRLPPRSKPPPR